MVDAADAKVVVIDNGSGMLKAGFAGEEAPSDVFPAIVGRPRTGQAMLGVSSKEHYIGEEAAQKAGVLNITNPIAHGKVESWDDMQRVWHHTFYTCLRVNPQEVAGVLLTEAPLQPKENREKMAEIMFESFQVPALYVAIQAVMSLYSAGRTTGLVVDSGDGVTHTVPVYEGFSIPHAIKRMDIAGRRLTQHVQKLCQSQLGRDFTSSSELQVVKKIKEELCFVCESKTQFDTFAAEAANSSTHDKNYELPDKSILNVKGLVRFKGPELLFQPELDGMTCDGMQKLADASIGDSDLDVRKDLAKNVILSGGTTEFEGLPDRLRNELIDSLPANTEVRVIAEAFRRYAVWRGASTLSSLSSFASQWVTKDEWDELGAQILQRKCS